MGISLIGQVVVDTRADAAAAWADPPVVEVWRDLGRITSADPPDMGLLAGERPAADVDVLASLAAAAEFELARRMVSAAAAGGLPLHTPGGMLRARGWSVAAARRLVTAGELALAFPAVAAQWAAGVITAEHAAAIAGNRGRLTDDQLTVALRGFDGRWGVLSPRAVGQVIAAIEAQLYPPQDPSPDEEEAYQTRNLSFALTPDVVLFSGTLPRLEGEAFVAVIEAFAESLRTQADHVPPAALRADALVALIDTAAATGRIPARGGLPVALNIVLTPTVHGDTLATTSRGHMLTASEFRFACCDPTITPLLTPPAAHATSPSTGAGIDHTNGRILAIAEALLGRCQPIKVGRTSRVATPAQRRALATRDQGCLIPGCGAPAETCQVHHLHAWADGGDTDLDNMVLLCWTHHRQVDLGMWRIESPPSGSPPTPIPTDPAPPGTPWPSNNNSGWIITRNPSHAMATVRAADSAQCWHVLPRQRAPGGRSGRQSHQVGEHVGDLAAGEDEGVHAGLVRAVTKCSPAAPVSFEGARWGEPAPTCLPGQGRVT